ncbi:MAG: AtpZ/AtpI family protein [Bacteroidota bacterium]
MEENKKEKDVTQSYMKYAGLGFEFLACVLLFMGLGYGLDKWLGTENPWFLLVCLVFGCVAGIYLLVKRLS